MAGILTVALDRPISAVSVMPSGSPSPGNGAENTDKADSDSGQQVQAAAKKQQQLLDQQRQRFEIAMAALQEASANINEIRQNVIKEHKQQIARLAVEIAQKILSQKIEHQDYEIEPIIANALDHCPSRGQIVVRLNPADLEQCRKLNLAEQDKYRDVTFVSDSGVGQAQCRVETDSGTIESVIKDQLERVEKALSLSH